MYRSDVENSLRRFLLLTRTHDQELEERIRSVKYRLLELRVVYVLTSASFKSSVMADRPKLCPNVG
jgi:hypothetical protein